MFENQVCAEIPNAFWNIKRHIIELPYEPDFDEKKIPTKARPIQMNARLMEIYKFEIQDLLNKKLIWKSSSPWSFRSILIKWWDKFTKDHLALPRSPRRSSHLLTLLLLNLWPLLLLV
ncbi:unnamed protein product [Prunus brigantina]